MQDSLEWKASPRSESQVQKFLGSITARNLDKRVSSNTINEKFDNYTFRSLLEGHYKQPEKSITPFSPITFGVLKSKIGKIKNSRLKTIKILIDSGASETIVSKSILGSIKITKVSNQQWNTARGVTTTAEEATIQFSLSEFYEKTII